MYCAKCGSQNDDNNYRCIQCGVQLLRPGEQVGISGADLGPAPTGLATAIIVTILCCWPFGIPAIVFAAQTMGHNSSGRYQEAHQSSKQSKKWSWIAFWIGLLVYIPYWAFSIYQGFHSVP